MSRFPKRPGWLSPEPCSRLIVYRLDLRGSTGFWIGGSGGNSGWENRGPEMYVTRNRVLTRSIEDGPPQGARQIFEKSPARHPPRRAAGRHPLGARASRPHLFPANSLPSTATPLQSAPSPPLRGSLSSCRGLCGRDARAPRWSLCGRDARAPRWSFFTSRIASTASMVREIGAVHQVANEV